MTAGAGSGALMTGTHQFMVGEGGLEGRTEGLGPALGTGAVVGSLAPAAGGLVQRILNSLRGGRAIRDAAAGAPTTQELRDQAQAIYGRIDDAGLQIRPETARATAGNLVDYLESQGAGLTSAERSIPQANALLGDFRALSQTQERTPWLQLDMIRRGLGNATSAADGNDARIVGQALSDFDDSVARIGPDDVTAGNPAALDELPAARDLWSQQARTGVIDDAIETGTAGGYLGGDASGIRNQVASILRNPTQRGRYSDAELELLRRAASGTVPQQMLYGLQSGLGQMFSLGTGLATGGVPGMAAGGLASMGLRGLSNRMARDAAQSEFSRTYDAHSAAVVADATRSDRTSWGKDAGLVTQADIESSKTVGMWKRIGAWWLIDLRAFRASLIRRSQFGHGLRYGVKQNPDGTCFTWFDIESFPAEPPLVVARSG